MIRVLPTSTPARKAAARLDPTAYKALPNRLRDTGIHTSAIASTSQMREGHGFEKPPTTRLTKSGEVPPPGPPRMSSATPGSMKLIASVTMMSGTPETTEIQPMIADRTTDNRMESTAMARQATRPLSFMSQAEKQLMKTTIDPTAKLKPPVMMTTPIAIARRASDRVPAVMVRTWKPPKTGT